MPRRARTEKVQRELQAVPNDAPPIRAAGERRADDLEDAVERPVEDNRLLDLGREPRELDQQQQRLVPDRLPLVHCPGRKPPKGG